MRFRPTERDQITDIFKEEIEEAGKRIQDRLQAYECHPVSDSGDKFDSIRRFYEDLTDKVWTENDEEALQGVSNLSDSEIKKIMRDAFQRSRISPVPSLAYLLTLHRKSGDDHGDSQEFTGSLSNPDAVSAAERERIANMLHRDLTEAAQEIASRLKLGEAKAEIVREQLEIVEGNVIGHFTPLV